MTSSTAFSASFRCGSRSAIPTGTTDPYNLRINSTLSNLIDDPIFFGIFADTGLGGISTQTGPTDFFTNNTPVECAVKVGD